MPLPTPRLAPVTTATFPSSAPNAATISNLLALSRSLEKLPAVDWRRWRITGRLRGLLLRRRLGCLRAVYAVTAVCSAHRLAGLPRQSSPTPDRSAGHLSGSAPRLPRRRGGPPWVPQIYPGTWSVAAGPAPGDSDLDGWHQRDLSGDVGEGHIRRDEPHASDRYRRLRRRGTSGGNRRPSWHRNVQDRPRAGTDVGLAVHPG